MTLIINNIQIQVIYDTAEKKYPEECCGILLGKIDRFAKTVVEVIATENIWEPIDNIDLFTRNRNSRYTIPPQEILKAQKQGRQFDLEIVGFFHSHPDNPAIPSSCDRDFAWDIYSYPIVSVIDGKVTDIQSWVLDEWGIFHKEEIHKIAPDRFLNLTSIDAVIPSSKSLDTGRDRSENAI